MDAAFLKRNSSRFWKAAFLNVQLHDASLVMKFDMFEKLIELFLSPHSYDTAEPHKKALQKKNSFEAPFFMLLVVPDLDPVPVSFFFLLESSL
jgi:hypothetical protein